MNTKDRLLKYLDYKGVKKADFYRTTGLSNGFLDKNININSDKIDIIISSYSDLDLFWLITGKGSMLRDSCPVPTENASEASQCKKNTEISERMVQVIDFYKTNSNHFAKTLGYSRSQAIYDMLSGKANPSFEFFNKFILSEYSECINTDWLITGRGEMLKSKIGDNTIFPEIVYKSYPQDADMIAAKNEIIASKDSIIERSDKLIHSLECRIKELEEKIRLHNIEGLGDARIAEQFTLPKSGTLIKK